MNERCATYRNSVHSNKRALVVTFTTWNSFSEFLVNLKLSDIGKGVQQNSIGDIPCLQPLFLWEKFVSEI